jgi:TetR/AcrR family transcriptional repressor of bet genes
VNVPRKRLAPVRTSIEAIRRRELIDAAYLTFLDHGLSGMTMARIGERAGMSHGIVNYYFRSKDELLSAVIRKAAFLIMKETAEELRKATTPRERVSAVIRANFQPDLFTREVAQAWVSFYAVSGQRPAFERLQSAMDRRVHSNLVHALRQLAPPRDAHRMATGAAVWIDGLWLRHAKSSDALTGAAAIALVEECIDAELARLRAG